jgi:hypothetical protein
MVFAYVLVFTPYWKKIKFWNSFLVKFWLSFSVRQLLLVSQYDASGLAWRLERVVVFYKVATRLVILLVVPRLVTYHAAWSLIEWWSDFHASIHASIICIRTFANECKLQTCTFQINFLILQSTSKTLKLNLNFLLKFFLLDLEVLRWLLWI